MASIGSSSNSPPRVLSGPTPEGAPIDSPPVQLHVGAAPSPPPPPPPPPASKRDKHPEPTLHANLHLNLDTGKRKASTSNHSAVRSTPDAPREKKKIKVGARASIACITCRKRKVRCSGEWPACAFCVLKKLDCVYDGHPAEHGPPAVGAPGWVNSEPVQTPTEAIMPDAHLTIIAIDSFLAHYHDMFPFLHRQSLFLSVRNGTASRELVCSILALAARFCQSLRNLHPSSPTAAAEYYAVLAAQLLSLPDAKPLFPTHSSTAHSNPLPDSEVSLTRCQCYLLLSLYELTAGRDHSGWLKLGQAIRMAQILRLGFDDEVDYSTASLGEDPRGRARSTPSSLAGSRDSSQSRTSNPSTPSDPTTSTSGALVVARKRSSGPVDPLQAETRRRTFWSCFLLDRTISDGNERPCGLKVPKIASLRMPGSDADFANGKKGMGARFDPDPPAWSVSVRHAQSRKDEDDEDDAAAPRDRPPRSRTTTVNQVEPEADLYGYTLRIADIWRSVASYIGAGGRNVDRRPPWQADSTFFALAGQLNEFGDRLPQELRYSDQTLIAHCMTSSMDARLFGMLHLMFATASHVLHRDYLPFLPPADFKAANGPVDGEPLYGDATSPAGWWQGSFDVAVHSAGIISDVCTHLASHGIVLAHPFAGYAALAAGTVHCHLKYWPQECHSAEKATAYFQQDCAFLNSLRNVYPIAARWCDAIAGLQLLYYNLSRGILDADPVKVRAGVIQLLRSAKEDQLSQSSATANPNTTAAAAATSNAHSNEPESLTDTANSKGTNDASRVVEGNNKSNSKVTPQTATLPPVDNNHAINRSNASTTSLEPSIRSTTTISTTSPTLPSATLSLTPSLQPVPGADLPTDFSFDLNSMTSVPGFGLGFDDLGYWGNSGGWLTSSGFGSLGTSSTNTTTNAASNSVFGTNGNDLGWTL
ncbi:Zn(II)2Cys6 transcription factor [Sporobolomyces koalae]|uniref:Zn(II)2Cys6 transcription factor n=1 Tax=Sporobolomyces koalae TaxID=500713 RepID=UPI00317C12EE